MHGSSLLVNLVSLRYYLFMNAIDLQHLLERLASLLRSETRQSLLEQGLQPVQFEALHYLSICNRYSDTPMAVTEYLGQTKGTVSQTLKVLEKKGLVEKVPDSRDKRVAHLLLSESGRALVEQMMPSPLLSTALADIADVVDLELAEQLLTLLRAMQRQNQFKTFGQCASCQHNIKLSENHYQCGLTHEPLSPADTQLICREHQTDCAA